MNIPYLRQHFQQTESGNVQLKHKHLIWDYYNKSREKRMMKKQKVIFVITKLFIFQSQTSCGFENIEVKLKDQTNSVLFSCRMFTYAN